MDCGLNDPTDFHSADGLEPLTQNGSRPIGAPFNAPAFPGVVPLTNAFVDDTGPAHDTVPPAQCEIDGKAVTVDARGAPRRDDGCDAGAIERTLCGPAVVYNVGSLIGDVGRKGERPASRARDAAASSVVFSQGGDDQFFIVRSCRTRSAAGAGDDIDPSPARPATPPTRSLAARGGTWSATSPHRRADRRWTSAAGTGDGPGRRHLIVSEHRGRGWAQTAQRRAARRRMAGTSCSAAATGHETLAGRGGIDFAGREGRRGGRRVIDCGPGQELEGEGPGSTQGLDPDAGELLILARPVNAPPRRSKDSARIHAGVAQLVERRLPEKRREAVERLFFAFYLFWCFTWKVIKTFDTTPFPERVRRNWSLDTKRGRSVAEAFGDGDWRGGDRRDGARPRPPRRPRTRS